MTYDYFYEEQSEQFSFYRIPKTLMTEKVFGGMSGDAKILYGLCLDRVSLSRKNGWIDKEKLMEDAAAYLNRKYGPDTVETELKETYYNMREMVEPHRHLIETARQAFVSQGVEPKTVPIRGGTDGARLSFMGLPCPNLSTGGYQFHGIYEFIPVRALETMPKVLLEIVYAYGGAEKYVSETN